MQVLHVSIRRDVCSAVSVRVKLPPLPRAYQNLQNSSGSTGNSPELIRTYLASPSLSKALTDHTGLSCRTWRQWAPLVFDMAATDQVAILVKGEHRCENKKCPNGSQVLAEPWKQADLKEGKVWICPVSRACLWGCREPVCREVG